MKAQTRFLLGGVMITGAVGYLMAEGIKDTGVYFLMPSELAERVAADSSMYNVGLRVGGHVVKGSITRDLAQQTVAFDVTDESGVTFPVIFKGIPPDTFTDSVEVVVEGRLHTDGTLLATNVLAKCGSRYEAVPSAES